MAKIEHRRDECIGCAACVAIHPKGWEMDGDGKSNIIAGKHKKDGNQEKEVTDKEDLTQHKEAAGCCPTNAIRIEE